MRRLKRWGGVALCAAAIFAEPVGARANESLSELDRHLGAGEFGAARQLVERLPAEDQDVGRARLAGALRTAGMAAAAARELGQMNDLGLRRSAVQGLLGAPHAVRFTGDSGGSYGASQLGYGDGTGPGSGLRPAPGGAGGAALADFDSLMDLIQNTIAPDTWDAVGGPSTMAPYRAGIHVDPAGLVRDIEVEAGDRLANARARALEAAGNGVDVKDNKLWVKASEMRIVSLKRLRESWLTRRLAGQQPTQAMANLAGLSEIRFLLITEDDILLAGTVGGIDPASAPWPTDTKTGRVALGLDVLMASAAAARAGAAYGCSIDPTAQGVAAAQQVSQQIGQREIPPATAADALADALGPQNITLDFVAGDTPLAWLLVDADRHMKQLALGLREMPEGVLNYLDIVEQRVRQFPQAGVPNGNLLRLWFAAEAKQIRGTNERDTFELSGLPIRLLSAKEFATLQGQRVQAGDDELGAAFTKQFNEHFEAIATKYPVYDRLRGAFELTAAMQLAKQTVGDEKFALLLGELAIPDLAGDTSLVTPAQCDSIAVRHTITADRKRHEVYVVSGGVHIDPADTLVSQIESYPALEPVGDRLTPPPVENTRWWWDR